MEDDDRRATPLLAYAALVCGGVVACLLLLAGPAGADTSDPEPGTPDRLLPLDRAGERVAATTRDVGRGTSDLVRQASAAAEPVAPVGEGAAEAVATTTERVADDVEGVTRGVDQVADEPETALPTDPPVEEPGGAEESGAPDDRVDRPLRATAAHVDVPTPDRDPAPRGVRATRTTPAAPASAPTLLTTAPPAGADAPAAVPEPGPLLLVAGCDDCAASGSFSGDPLLVLGLPTYGVTTPRFADSAPHGAVVGGPATVFHRPDVSPD